MADSKHWDNEQPIPARTKIALRVLMLVFAILKPYEYGTKFEKEIDAVNKAINE